MCGLVGGVPPARLLVNPFETIESPLRSVDISFEDTPPFDWQGQEGLSSVRHSSEQDPTIPLFSNGAETRRQNDVNMAAPVGLVSDDTDIY